MPMARLLFSPANPMICLVWTLAQAAAWQQLVTVMHRTHIGNPDLIGRHEQHLRDCGPLLSKR